MCMMVVNIHTPLQFYSQLDAYKMTQDIFTLATIGRLERLIFTAVLHFSVIPVSAGSRYHIKSCAIDLAQECPHKYLVI